VSEEQAGEFPVCFRARAEPRFARLTTGLFSHVQRRSAMVDDAFEENVR